MIFVYDGCSLVSDSKECDQAAPSSGGVWGLGSHLEIRSDYYGVDYSQSPIFP